MPWVLLQNTRQHALDSGFDLFGVVDPARFDASQPREQRVARLQPRCGAVIVIGSGGIRRGQPGAGPDLRQLAAALGAGRRRVVTAEPGRCELRFARLAEAAGLGTVSPVTGLLLHPEFGPWLRVHGALLVEGNPFGAIADTAISDDFQPCCTCRQPCLEAVSEPALACCLGVEHSDGFTSPMPQVVPARMSRLRWLQISAQRLVPRFLRRSSPAAGRVSANRG